MYVSGNPKTKKELREMVKVGTARVFAPGLGTPKENGVEYVEGPQFPAAHQWYARVSVKNGSIVKVM